jgi:hypothetical protein
MISGNALPDLPQSLDRPAAMSNIFWVYPEINTGGGRICTDTEVTGEGHLFQI